MATVANKFERPTSATFTVDFIRRNRSEYQSATTGRVHRSIHCRITKDAVLGMNLIDALMAVYPEEMPTEDAVWQFLGAHEQRDVPLLLKRTGEVLPAQTGLFYSARRKAGVALYLTEDWARVYDSEPGPVRVRKSDEKTVSKALAKLYPTS